MPVQSCTVNGKGGYRWGTSGKCYAHDGTETGRKAARKKAIKQGLAVGDGKLDYAAESDTRGVSKLCLDCGKMKGDQSFGQDMRTKDGLAKTCQSCSGTSYALDVVDITAVDIMAADVTVHGAGSPAEGDTYSVADLEALAEASNEVCADLRPPVKIGHNAKQRLLANSGLSADETPAAGFMENFRVDGDKLLCDLKGVPKKLAELVEAGAFRFRSTELRPLKSQRTKKSYKSVVSGLALLGATAPAFQTLDDIHKWYAGTDPAEPTGKLLLEDVTAPVEPGTVAVDYAAGDVTWNEEQGTQDMMDDLRVALNPGVDNYRYSIVDLDVANGRALVSDWTSNLTWVVPYAMVDGDPSPAPAADWVLVERAWVEATDGPARANGEAVQETPRAADTTATMPKTADKTKPLDEITLSDEQVKAFAELLELEADATAEDVLKKIAAQAEAPAPPDEPPAPPAPPAPADQAKSFAESREYADLKTKADLGERIFEERRVEKRDALIHGAVGDGKIEPSEVKFYADKYDEDPAFTAEFIKRLPVNEEWKRVYGSDEDGITNGSDADERAYAAYCATAGIPYYPTGRV